MLKFGRRSTAFTGEKLRKLTSSSSVNTAVDCSSSCRLPSDLSLLAVSAAKAEPISHFLVSTNSLHIPMRRTRMGRAEKMKIKTSSSSSVCANLNRSLSHTLSLTLYKSCTKRAALIFRAEVLAERQNQGSRFVARQICPSYLPSSTSAFCRCTKARVSVRVDSSPFPRSSSVRRANTAACKCARRGRFSRVVPVVIAN